MQRLYFLKQRLCIFLAVHSVRDNCDYLIIAAAAACGALCCILYIFEYIQQLVHIILIVYSVENIKICNVITTTYDVIFVALCVYRRQVAYQRLLNFAEPQTVEIAVRVDSQRFFVIYGKCCLRCVASFKEFAVYALVCLKVYPLNAVVLCHRMRF